MSDPFVGEIRIFALNFPPAGWAFCNGQTLAISQYPDLFVVIGTTYGGDGVTSFAVPDLQGRAPMHPGQGPGLSQRVLGEAGGAEDVTLSTAHMPAHQHAIQASSSTADSTVPATTAALAATNGGSAYRASGTLTQMGDMLSSTGGGQPHYNMQPYMTFYFCIALVGMVPVPN